MDKSKSNASDPFAAALRLLSGRDMSEAELRRKLARFGFSAAAIDGAVSRCLDYNYLDDRRYALLRARSLARSGRGVGRKILLDLKQRGIDATTAEQTLDIISQETPPAEILQDLLQRRFVGFNFHQASDRERRRVVTYLQRRGFPLELIFSTLRDGGED